MGHDALRRKLTELFLDTERAHGGAFEGRGGEDPEWPIWYANVLREPLGALLRTEFTASQLVVCLMDAHGERAVRSPGSEWPVFLADYFLERFAAAEDGVAEQLALYHFPGCPFCVRVREVIDRLGINVELRDIHSDPEHWDALVAVRGRSTVPVLRITTPGSEDRWMPESRDIIHHLEQTYA